MPLPKKVSAILKISGLVFILGALVLMLVPGILSNYTMELSKVDGIPDIKQTDKRFAFPDKGLDFCAPVVVLDSLVWLRNNGYDQIFPKPATPDEEAQVTACRRLAELMETKTGPGTTTEQLLVGVKRYIEKCTPYRILSLKYRGWNRHSTEFDDGDACPSLKWIKDGIRANRSEWINIGWYKMDPQTKTMKRQEGHWVTLIGYGIGIDGAADPNTLIVRDPSPVLSQDPRKIFITVEPLPEGKLTGAHAGLPRDAKGYLFINSMGNGFDSSAHRNGIIDGSIVLDLYPPWLPR